MFLIKLFNLRKLHVINELDDGDAEGLLYRVFLYDKEHEHIVLLMQELGKYGEMLSCYGIQVRLLNISKLKKLPKARLNFRKVLKITKPDFIQA